jgi:E3 ubiquitin-protein ligase HERC2
MAGPEFSSCVEDKNKEVFAIYEDTLHKNSPPAAVLTGPELASMMKIGTRVVRGVDWKWGDQVSACILIFIGGILIGSGT